MREEVISLLRFKISFLMEEKEFFKSFKMRE
jgi:hypothetical protein